jgi:hypothetical protein
MMCTHLINNHILPRHIRKFKLYITSVSFNDSDWHMNPRHTIYGNIPLTLKSHKNGHIIYTRWKLGRQSVSGDVFPGSRWTS